MIRGSTPAHYFELPFDTSFVKECMITYQQGRATILEKTEKDSEFDDERIIVELTQEETLKFDEERPVHIQIKVLTHDGKVLPSQVFTVPCGRILNPEVME